MLLRESDGHSATDGLVAKTAGSRPQDVGNLNKSGKGGFPVDFGRWPVPFWAPALFVSPHWGICPGELAEGRLGHGPVRGERRLGIPTCRVPFSGFLYPQGLPGLMSEALGGWLSCVGKGLGCG